MVILVESCSKKYKRVYVETLVLSYRGLRLSVQPMKKASCGETEITAKL